MSVYPWQGDLWQRWCTLRSRQPHAILLKGPQGTGKLDFALYLAKSLLCEAPINDGACCGECPSCHWFSQGSHPDFRLLQPAALNENEEVEEGGVGKKKPSRQISVDQVRSLADFASLSAHRGGHRVVLIHPAEAMNVNAASALLKTLEEPTAGMVMILVSHKTQQLLPTIMSRCIVLAAPLPLLGQSLAWLRNQGMTEETAARLLAQAGFAPLAALDMAQSQDGADSYERFISALCQPKSMDVYALAEQLQKSEPGLIVHWLQQWCYDIASYNLTKRIRYCTQHIDDINGISFAASPISMMQFQKELATAKREAQHPLNARLQLEALFLSYRNMML